MKYINKNSGFTLIELLIVVAIIGLLSTVILTSLSSSKAKARDTKRLRDMQEIYTALNLFYDTYGCLPFTGSSSCGGVGVYSEVNSGGWDYSSQGGFMTFLKNSGFMSEVPVDPKNNMPGDATAGTYAYRYYCYSSGSANPGLHLGYWKEDNTYVYKNNRNSTGSWTDTFYNCK